MSLKRCGGGVELCQGHDKGQGRDLASRISHGQKQHEAFHQIVCFQRNEIHKSKGQSCQETALNGNGKKCVNKFEGVSKDVFVENCSKMLVLLTNDRRQQVQQKMQKQHMNE